MGGDFQTFPFTFSNSEAVNNYMDSLLGHGYSGWGSVGGVGAVFANNVATEVQGGSGFGNSIACLVENNEMYSCGYENGDWTPYYLDVLEKPNIATVLRTNFTHNQIQLPGTRRAGVMRAEQPGSHQVGNIFYKTGEYALSAGVQHAQSASNNRYIGLPYTQTLETPAPLQPTNAYQVVKTPQEIADAFVIARTQGQRFDTIKEDEARWGMNFWTTPYYQNRFPVRAAELADNPFYHTSALDYRGNIVTDVTDTSVAYVARGPEDGETLASLGLTNVFQAHTEYAMSSYEDPQVGDFRLKSSVNTVDGFWRIPLEDVGLFVDEYRDTVPHKETYRASANLRWSAFKSAPRSGGFIPNRASDVYPENLHLTLFNYDLGRVTSPLGENFDLVTNRTVGTYGWTNTVDVNAFDGGSGNNDVDRDGVGSNKVRVFEQKVPNGIWYARVTFGDTASRQGMKLRAEGLPYEPGNDTIATAPNQRVLRTVSARVTDGRLSLEFAGDPVTGNVWGVSSIVIRDVPFGGQPQLRPERLGRLHETRDIGSTSLAGNVFARSNGQYFLDGSGTDIWGTQDSFQYSSETVTADALSIRAKVSSVTNSHPWAKAGVMYRENLGDASPHVSVFVRPDGQVAMQWRTTEGGNSGWGGSLVGGAGLPKWVRVDKAGDTYTGYYSTDGISWTMIQEIVVTMGNNNHVGLALTSHNNSQLGTAVFEDLSIEVSLGRFEDSQDIGAPAIAGNAAANSSGQYTLNASGPDIWGVADSFHYLNEESTGAALSARTKVESLTNTNQWAKTGVMYRDNFNAGSRYVGVLLRPDGQVVMQWRDPEGAASAGSSLTGGTGLPKWLRLDKNNDVYTGFYSTDGINWTEIQSVTIAMGNSNHIGLALTSHDNSKVATAVFSELSFDVAAAAPVALTVPSGFTQLEFRHSGKCVDNKGATGASAQEGEFHQWTCGSNPNRNFLFTAAGGGYYTVKSERSDLCLDLAAGSTADGAKLQQWACDPSNPNQLWRLQDQGGGWFQLVSQHSEKCVDVLNSDLENQGGILQKNCDDTKESQQLRFR